LRVLVTGGAGFIGSHTVDALLEKGYDVRILDNLQKPVHLKGKPPWIPKEAEFTLGDVRDKSAWEKALKDIDAVYHFAAYQDYLPDFSTFFHVNSVGTALLYEVAVEQKMELAKVIVASSQFVQGEGLYECPACRGQRADGQEKDEHRTSNVSPSRRLLRAGGQHRMTNEKNREQPPAHRGLRSGGRSEGERVSEREVEKVNGYSFS